MDSNSSKDGVTVILLNYKRPHNMAKVIASIKAQIVPTEIILVDNSNDRYLESNWVDIVIQPSANLGCYIRLLMAHYATHDHVVLMDDDLAITDSGLFAWLLINCTKSITGAYGRLVDFDHDKPYSGQEDIANGWVNAIKGRFMFFHKSVLDRVPIGSGAQPYDPFNEDLYFSFCVGGGEPVHYVSGYIANRLQNLDMASGLCDAPDHMMKRDAMCKWWKERKDTLTIREIF